MRRPYFIFTTLLLVVLLLSSLPALPARADEPPPLRNAFRAEDDGLVAETGRLRAELTASGLPFLPSLGPDAPPAHLNFRLQEIRRGDNLLYTADDTPPVLQDQADHAAYARPGGILEVYWTLDYAIEQTFVLARPVDGTGDLVFVGAISTNLVPAQTGLLSGPARFPVDEVVELTYGPATVLDASGRSAPVALWLEAGQVRLVVPGDWLSAAQYPVVVDPLLGVAATNVSNDTAYDQKTPVIGDAVNEPRFLVAWADNRNGNWDIYGQCLNDDGNLDGTLRIIDNSANGQTAPAIGSDHTNDQYMVAYESTVNGNTDVYAKILDQNGDWIADVILDNGADAQSTPAVAFDTANTRYISAWVDGAAGNADIHARSVSADGSLDFERTVIETAADQFAPAVAYDVANARSLFAWQENGNLYARTCDLGADTCADIVEVAVTADAEQNPSLAYNERDGQLLVVYERVSGGQTYIYGQRLEWNGSNYAALSGSGVRLSPAISLYTHTSPQVAYMPGTNDYVVAWRVGSGEIEVQQVSNAGEAGAFTASLAGTAGDAYPRQAPAIVATTNGRVQYVAVWQQEDDGATPGMRQQEVYARRLDTSFAVATGADYDRYASAAYDPTNNQYLVAWVHQAAGTSSYSIYGRLYSDQGVTGPSTIVICGSGDGCTYAARKWVDVAYDLNKGRFLAVWEDERLDGGNIYGREVNADGAARGTPFVISGAASAQGQPALAYDNVGQQYLVTWQDRRSGSSLDIYGARVIPQLVGNPTVSPLSAAIATNVADELAPDVAANPAQEGNRFFTVWYRDGGVYGRFISNVGDPQPATLTVIRPDLIPKYPGALPRPTVAYLAADGYNRFLTIDAVYVNSGGITGLYARLVNYDGTLVGDDPFQVGTETFTSVGGNVAPMVSLDGGLYMLAWWGSEAFTNDAMRGCRVQTDGAIPTEDAPTSLYGRELGRGSDLYSVPALACSGSRCLAVRWAAQEDIYAGFVYR